MKTLGKQNTGIVGFSYEITDIKSKKPLTIKREFGKKTSQKVKLAHGYNWSDEHWWGYGYSYVHMAENGPFYSIVGGYTDYTSRDSKSLPVKADEWGIETESKYCVYEGYSWNKFLDAIGYSRMYVYLLEKENINNILGGKIQGTSKNSKSPWVETSAFGEKRGKETIWGSSYGWSEKYDYGYNYFSLYTDETLNLDNKDVFWGKINEIEQEREAEKRKTEQELTKAREGFKVASDAKAKAEDELKNTQTELERMRKQNEFLLKQLEEQQAQIQQNYPSNPGKS